jgi:phospholipid transport system substrate-binding protein
MSRRRLCHPMGGTPTRWVATDLAADKAHRLLRCAARVNPQRAQAFFSDTSDMQPRRCCDERKHFMIKLTLRTIQRFAAVGLFAVSVAAVAQPAAGTPDGLVKQISDEVITTVKGDKAMQGGDVGKIVALVEAKVLPHMDFKRMTASAVGRNWREATPAQQAKLTDEFKTLLVRTYAGALTEVRENTTVGLKPLRASAEDTEVVVRTEVKAKGEPIQLDYRLYKDASAWKVYDINVLGVWLVDQYRSSFQQEVSAGGVDGLIAKLIERNKKASGK